MYVNRKSVYTVHLSTEQRVPTQQMATSHTTTEHGGTYTTNGIILNNGARWYLHNKQHYLEQRSMVVLTQLTAPSWTAEHGGSYTKNGVTLNNGTWWWYLHDKRRYLEQRNTVVVLTRQTARSWTTERGGTYTTKGAILNNGTRWYLHNKRRHLEQRNAVVIKQQTAPSSGPEFGTGRSQPHPWRTKRRCSEEKNGFIKVRRNHWNVTFSVVEIKSIIISIWKADMHLNTMNVPDMQRALRWGFTNIPGQPVVVSSK